MGAQAAARRQTHPEDNSMKRIAFFPLAVIAVSVVYATTLLAQTAAPAPGAPTTQKSAQPKTKTKATEPEPRVEGSYDTEAEAKRACADAAVVWVNTRSKVFHAAGTRDYGKTRRGFYMCQANAERLGFRSVKPPQKGKKKDTKA
jgi:hypothetical protein